MMMISNFGGNSCSDDKNNSNNPDDELNENSNISMCMLSGSC